MIAANLPKKLEPGLSAVSPAASEGIRLLLVDDDGAYRSLMRQVLAKHYPDLQVAEAKTGNEGLQFLKTKEFDCVLLDLGLPDIDGSEFIRIASRENVLMPPVIVLTGAHGEELGVKLIEEGAQDYLIKGDHRDHSIARSIRYAIQRHRLAAELMENQKILQLQKEAIQKQARSLVIANRCRSEFLGSLTHDLRSPLNSILLLSRSLIDNKDGNLSSRQVQAAEAIQSSATRLLATIEEILTVSRNYPQGSDASALNSDQIDDEEDYLESQSRLISKQT